MNIQRIVEAHQQDPEWAYEIGMLQRLQATFNAFRDHSPALSRLEAAITGHEAAQQDEYLHDSPLQPIIVISNQLRDLQDASPVLTRLYQHFRNDYLHRNINTGTSFASGRYLEEEDLAEEA